VVVGEDLDFDVPGRLDKTFQEQGVVAEGARRHPSGREQRCRHILEPLHDVHALATATSRGLDEQGEADAGRRLDERLVAQSRFGDTRDAGDAVRHDVVLGADLVAHDLDGVNAGADERDACRVQGLGKLNVFGQESIPRVDRLGTALQAGLDDGVDPQVAVRRRGCADPDGRVCFAHVAGPGVGV